MEQGKKRIEFLDAFRGIAILVVILYHIFSRWVDCVPYGDRFARFPLFQYGWLGVQLFFLLSGFVILMTLEKSKNFLQFLKKRWLRLFPAMLIATVFIFAAGLLMPERPEGLVELKNCLPGLLFIEPEWIKLATGIPIKPLDGAFWSLFAEVKFYFIFGGLYFLFGRNKAIMGLFCCYIIWMLPHAWGRINGHSATTDYWVRVVGRLSFMHFGWFVSGALGYIYYHSRHKKDLLLAVASALFSVLSLYVISKSAGVILTALLIVTLFLSSLHFERLQQMLAQRTLLFFGFISYPLYLIHQDVTISLIGKMKKLFPSTPDILLPLAPISLIVLIAWLIARYAEPALQNILRRKRNAL